MRSLAGRLSGVLLVLVLAQTALAAHVPPERRIEPAKSLGPIAIGMTRAEAIAAVQRAGVGGPVTLQDLGDAVQLSVELDAARFPAGEDRQPQVLSAQFARGVDRVLRVRVDARGRPGMQTEQGIGGGTSVLVAARVLRPTVIKTELAYGGRLITEFSDLGIGFVSRAGAPAILELYVTSPQQAIAQDRR